MKEATHYKIERVAVSALRPYERNARAHSDAQVDAIATSIREFGFNNPVLIDGAGTILAGHGRVMAAKRLGMQAVPCIRLAHLDENSARAFILADNRLAELASWDDALLASELEDLDLGGFDLALTGFDADALGAVFARGGHDAASMSTPSELLRDGSEPTADDYNDMGHGARNAAEGRAILFPLLVQLSRADYRRWKTWRGRRSDRDALLALMETVAPQGDESEVEK